MKEGATDFTCSEIAFLPHYLVMVVSAEYSIIAYLQAKSIFEFWSFEFLVSLVALSGTGHSLRLAHGILRSSFRRLSLFDAEKSHFKIQVHKGLKRCLNLFASGFFPRTFLKLVGHFYFLRALWKLDAAVMETAD